MWRKPGQRLLTLISLGGLFVGVIFLAHGVKGEGGPDWALAAKGVGVMAVSLGLGALARRLGSDSERREPRRYRDSSPSETPEETEAARRVASGVEEAYAAGLADLEGDGPLGRAPAGLAFLLPYAVAAARAGAASGSHRWPSFAALSEGERGAAELIHTCLAGSSKQVDSIVGTALGGRLFEPMYMLFRANEKFWGLEPGYGEGTTRARLREARGGKPARLIPRAELDERKMDASARASAVRIAAVVAEYGSLPGRVETATLREEIETRFPALLIQRLPRGGGAWAEARSWLGGRPRLGDQAWPRGADGRALTFAAQIDLREVAEEAGFEGLPVDGSLAFFLGGERGGAVVHAPSGGLETPTPDDAPSVEEMTGAEDWFDGVGWSAPREFPCWPVGVRVLGVGYDAEEEEETAAVERHARRRRYFFDGKQAGLEQGPGWWRSGLALAAGLQRARERGRGSAESRAELDALVEEVTAWASGRSPWDSMTTEEEEAFRSYFSDARERFSDWTRYVIPTSLEQMATETVLRMATAEDAVYEQLPGSVRERIDADYLLPTDGWHQMFGRGVSIQDNAAVEHEGDHMLLQLVYDDMVAWRFGDMGAFQFWISPRDLKRGRWERATATFECH